jgi:hypothetical protein
MDGHGLKDNFAPLFRGLALFMPDMFLLVGHDGRWRRIGGNMSGGLKRYGRIIRPILVFSALSGFAPFGFGF